jgi:hypothetical protein
MAARGVAARIVVAVLIAMWCCACTSVQWVDAGGRPRSFGLSNLTTSRDTTVTRIVAPGVSLRLIPGMVGCSLGWRETVLFQTGPRTGRQTVAYADRVYGIAFDAMQIVAGAAASFVVIEPPAGSGITQMIHYSQGNPAECWIRRKETQ